MHKHRLQVLIGNLRKTKCRCPSIIRWRPIKLCTFSENQKRSPNNQTTKKQTIISVNRPLKKSKVIGLKVNVFARANSIVESAREHQKESHFRIVYFFRNLSSDCLEDNAQTILDHFSCFYYYFFNSILPSTHMRPKWRFELFQVRTCLRA